MQSRGAIWSARNDFSLGRVLSEIKLKGQKLQITGWLIFRDLFLIQLIRDLFSPFQKKKDLFSLQLKRTGPCYDDKGMCFGEKNLLSRRTPAQASMPAEFPGAMTASQASKPAWRKNQQGSNSSWFYFQGISFQGLSVIVLLLLVCAKMLHARSQNLQLLPPRKR